MDLSHNSQTSNTKKTQETIDHDIPKVKDLIPSEKVSRKQYRKSKKKAVRKVNRQKMATMISLSSKACPKDLEAQQKKLKEEYETQKALWEAREAAAIQNLKQRSAHENFLKEEIERGLGKCSEKCHDDCQSSSNTTTQSLGLDVKPYKKELPAEVEKDKKLTSVSVKEKEPCIMFLKTGACRLGPACQRLHTEVPRAQALIFPRMFRFPAGLVSENAELAPQSTRVDNIFPKKVTIHEVTLTAKLLACFHEFFKDVLPELSCFGIPIDIKVSLNTAPHLQGNVYVVYSSSDIAEKVLAALHGRYYDKMTLFPRFLGLETLKPALCGSYSHNQKCNRGYFCNYLHTFVTPAINNYTTPILYPKEKYQSYHNRDKKPNSDRKDFHSPMKTSEDRRGSNTNKRLFSEDKPRSLFYRKRRYISPNTRRTTSKK